MILDIKAVKNSYLFETKLNKAVVELAKIERTIVNKMDSK